jgi:MoaA/NifB/PqqE/SkfB family radical SAM enzyme
VSIETETESTAAPAFRIDVNLHELLKNSRVQRDQPLHEPDEVVSGGLPDPVYPQRPEVMWPTEREYHNFKAWRTWKGLGAPYFKSRFMPGQLRPLIAYLFSEWKCNLDCHYCWSYDNSIKGMTEPTAKLSIDWLHSIGNRFLALMGGEPLLRPKFIHKIVYYAAKKDFLVYLPTNGRLMKPDVIDRLGDAGLCCVNLAVDCIDEKPGLAKALTPIRPYFEYLIKNQRKYCTQVFFNVCICRTNIEDVKQLTELAKDYNIGIDFHIVESPLIDSPHFKHLGQNSTFLTPADYPMVDDLIDWLAEKHRQGYKIVNQRDRLLQMKDFMRGRIEPWGCRAGQNTMIIRTDGTLAPCFPMYSATYDWGVAGNPKFDNRQLAEMKKTCETSCFSTLNHIVSYVYNNGRVIKWMINQYRKNRWTEATGTVE